MSSEKKYGILDLENFVPTEENIAAPTVEKAEKKTEKSISEALKEAREADKKAREILQAAKAIEEQKSRDDIDLTKARHPDFIPPISGNNISEGDFFDEEPKDSQSTSQEEAVDTIDKAEERIEQKNRYKIYKVKKFLNDRRIEKLLPKVKESQNPKEDEKSKISDYVRDIKSLQDDDVKVAAIEFLATPNKKIANKFTKSIAKIVEKKPAEPKIERFADKNKVTLMALRNKEETTLTIMDANADVLNGIEAFLKDKVNYQRSPNNILIRASEGRDAPDNKKYGCYYAQDGAAELAISFPTANDAKEFVELLSLKGDVNRFTERAGVYFNEIGRNESDFLECYYKEPVKKVEAAKEEVVAAPVPAEPKSHNPFSRILGKKTPAPKADPSPNPSPNPTEPRSFSERFPKGGRGGRTGE